MHTHLKSKRTVYFNEDFLMYKIIGQPINMRYLSRLHKDVQPLELNEKTLRLNQICEFGLKYGYKATVDAFRISKSTYYAYLKMYKQSTENGILFEFKSTRPHNFRRAQWNKKVVNLYPLQKLGWPY
jgi:hypothetical protein